MFDTAVPVVEVAAHVRDATATGAAARVCDAAAALAAVARSSAAWTAADRASVLVAVRAAQAALAEAQGFVLVADRDAGDSLRPGDRSFEAAQARVTRSGLGEASRVVRQADALVSMGTVAAGVREGSVPLGHLDELARVAAAATPEVAAVLRTPQAQEQVVGMARVASRPDFARALARWVAAQDPGALEAEHEAQHRERFFSLSAQPDGVFLKGRLDRIAGESLRVALDAMGQYGDDTRSPGQASADALTMLAEHACAGSGPRSAVGGAGGADTAAGGDAADRPVGGLPGSVSRPHVSLLVAAETIAELLTHQRALDEAAVAAHGRAGTLDDAATRADAATLNDADRRDDVDARRAGAGLAPGHLCAPIALPWGTVAPATLEDGTPVPMSELARVLCEAEITRIVMSAESLPLDVGRSKRLFTTAQRRAAVVRDGQCVWNGCEQHASRCEVHHIRWWGRDSGATSLSNAALLCKHHHSEVHRLNLTIHRLEKLPGWTRRQRAKAELRESTTGMSALGATGAVGASIDAPTTGRAPLRYAFRNHRGYTVNAPDGHPPG
ncbi:hypothetical protein [Cellulomonas sp.]|uniref:HNH endonuclease signature motif containing protein n=1 Tax=Cellulomonas sp. TaxID=40001 RepID=UPI003BAA00B6